MAHIGDAYNKDGRIPHKHGLIILLCGAWFANSEVCCPACHKDTDNLITLNPRKDGTTDIDFSLPIQACVCCRAYDLARAEKNDFWLKEVEKRGHRRMTGFDRPVYTPAIPLPSTRRTIRAKRQDDDDDVPSMEDFLWSIRKPKT